MYTITVTDEEINDLLNKCSDAEENGSDLPGMTYEEGIKNALMWATGQIADNPFD